MLLKSYSLKIFRPDCNHNFQTLLCIATLDEDISGVIPYLNTELGGTNYIKDPPSVTFKAYGKLITLHSREIAVNALKDIEEAEKIISWIQKEVNRTWDNRENITPSYGDTKKPEILKILKLLPQKNCRECGLPTCMVFAVRSAEGSINSDNCTLLSDDNRKKLADYLGQFHINY